MPRGGQLSVSRFVQLGGIPAADWLEVKSREGIILAAPSRCVPNESSTDDGPNPIDAVPLLLERIESDVSMKVRRQAASMLAHHRSPDARVLPVFKRLLMEESDRKLRLHAEQGIRRYAAAGLGG